MKDFINPASGSGGALLDVSTRHEIQLNMIETEWVALQAMAQALFRLDQEPEGVENAIGLLITELKIRIDGMEPLFERCKPAPQAGEPLIDMWAGQTAPEAQGESPAVAVSEEDPKTALLRDMQMLCDLIEVAGTDAMMEGIGPRGRGIYAIVSTAAELASDLNKRIDGVL